MMPLATCSFLHFSLVQYFFLYIMIIHGLEVIHGDHNAGRFLPEGRRNLRGEVRTSDLGPLPKCAKCKLNSSYDMEIQQNFPISPYLEATLRSTLAIFAQYISLCFEKKPMHKARATRRLSKN
mmetsp:Transcript_11317/g.18335  ORF Transcript_11317/g.18335 Transcript_11317/m.18335 type:complete len:123 (+) Transcript_11317:6148-6516(+)